MFDCGRDKLPTDNRRPEHLRHGMLVKHAILLPLDRQADVDAAAFGRRDLGIQTLLREVDLARVRRVELDHRRLACNLQSERRRVRH